MTALVSASILRISAFGSRLPGQALRHAAALVRAIQLIFVTAGILVLHRISHLGPGGEAAGFRAALRLNERWARSIRRILGIRVTVSGPLPPPCCFLAPNHTGYLDAAALASILPCFFAPKAEIKEWPLLGWLLSAGEHVFVDRTGGRALAEASRGIERRLRAGFPVCVFLEGTSTGGGPPLPFHASLLAAPRRAGVPVIPVAILWRFRREGAGDPSRDLAYWGDHVLVPHLWNVLGIRDGIEAEIRFGPPESASGEGSAARAELAGRLHRSVTDLLAEASASRESDTSFSPPAAPK